MSELTEEQLKNKYGPLKLIEVEDGDKVYKAYLRKNISRNAFSKAYALSDTDPVMACEIIYRDTVVQEISDSEIVENDDLFLSVMSEINDLYKKKKVTTRHL